MPDLDLVINPHLNPLFFLLRIPGVIPPPWRGEKKSKTQEEGKGRRRGKKWKIGRKTTEEKDGEGGKVGSEVDR